MSDKSVARYMLKILLLERAIKNVRSVDLARALKVSKPSVCRAVHYLEEHGYIEIANNGFLILTAAGREIATNCVAKYQFFKSFLTGTGVPVQQAAQEAEGLCLELSDQSYDYLKALCN